MTHHYNLGDEDGGGGVGEPPTEVWLELYRRATSKAHLDQLVAEWKQQQGQGQGVSAVFAALPPNVRENGKQINEYQWIDNSTGLVYFYEPKGSTPFWRKGTVGESKTVLAGVGDPDGAPSPDRAPTRLQTDDPRYWEQQRIENEQNQAELDFNYAELDSQERRDYDQMYQDNLHAGMDADTARRNAIVQLVQSRNSLAADVASTSASVAKTAADYASNPRDAVADLLYRNATGGNTPFSSTQGAAFGQYQTDLDQRFQDMFGGVAGDLNKAREYRDAIPLPEFFEPIGPQMQQMQQATQPAQNEMEQLRNALGGAGLRDDGLTGNLTQKGQDFIKWVTAANGGVQPTTAEGGANMNIMEPSMVVGQSGRIYATLAELDPEQLIVKPLKSVQDRQKQQKQPGNAQQQFLDQTRGAQRFARGGSINIAGGTLPAPKTSSTRQPISYQAPRYQTPPDENPYGPEIPGLTSRIGVGRDPDGTPNNSAGVAAGIDAALRLRAGQPLRFGRGRTTGRAAFGGGGARSASPTSAAQTDFFTELRKRLEAIDPQAVAGPGQTLPDPRLLSARVADAFETDEDLRDYVLSGFSKFGISPKTLLSTIQKFRPTGMNQPTQVSYR